MFPFGSLYQHSDQLLSHLKIIFDFSQSEIRGALGLPRLAWIRHAWCSTLFFSFSITVASAFFVSFLNAVCSFLTWLSHSPPAESHPVRLWPLRPPFSLSWAGALCSPHLRFHSSLDSPSYQADDGWLAPTSKPPRMPFSLTGMSSALFC